MGDAPLSFRPSKGSSPWPSAWGGTRAGAGAIVQAIAIVLTLLLFGFEFVKLKTIPQVGFVALFFGALVAELMLPRAMRVRPGLFFVSATVATVLGHFLGWVDVILFVEHSLSPSSRGTMPIGTVALASIFVVASSALFARFIVWPVRVNDRLRRIGQTVLALEALVLFMLDVCF